MDRFDLSEQIELLREDAPEVADARRQAAADPQLAERWERIRAYDEALGRGLRKVDAPVGLEDRLLQRVAGESKRSADRRRRQFVVGGLGAAVALSLLIAVSIWRRPDKGWTPFRVGEAAAIRYAGRHALPRPAADMRPLAIPGLRSASIEGFDEITFLGKHGSAYRLASPDGAQAVAIFVSSAWFPSDFDFAPTYFATPEGAALEVRFLPTEDGDQYCILVAPDLKPFEAKTEIL